MTGERRGTSRVVRSEVMGVPVLLEGPPALLDLADGGAAALPDGAHASPERPLHLRLALQAGGARAAAGTTGRPGPLIDVAGDRLRLRGAGAQGAADARRGHARARIAVSLLSAEPLLCREVLDTLLLFLVTARDRQPVHAAGVLLGGGALVLAGASGTGKSTLAYAAHRAGLAVLADDAVYLQSRPGLCVWGLRRPVGLPPDAVAFFPELRDLAPVRRPDGREKILVPLGGLPPAHASCAPPAGLCLLTRDGGPDGGAERLDPGAAAASLLSSLQPGFDRFASTLRDPLLALAREGAWRVALPADPSAAVRLLTALP